MLVAACLRFPRPAPAATAASRLFSTQNYVDKIASLEKRVKELESQLPAVNVPAKIDDWSKIGFGITPTHGHVKYTWCSSTGKWDEGVFVSDPYINLHIHAGVLHYGMSLFEGCKAFRSQDNKIKVLNLNENSARINRGLSRLVMPAIEEDMFNEAVDRAVAANAEYVPPFGTGASMYIRPFAFVNGPVLGLAPGHQFTFIVSVTPVGNYFGAGAIPTIKAKIELDYDRAAPRGTGNVKAGGNYAADLLPTLNAKSQGFGTTLYLDATEQKYIEEFSVSNFIGIDAAGNYVTPTSNSILPSITNKMLMQCARDMGIKVEQRPVTYEEIKTFQEVGGCGTAVVLAPMGSITKGQETIEFGKFDILGKVRQRLVNICNGVEEDLHGWLREVEVEASKEAIAAQA